MATDGWLATDRRGVAALSLVMNRLGYKDCVRAAAAGRVFRDAVNALGRMDLKQSPEAGRAVDAFALLPAKRLARLRDADFEFSTNLEEAHIKLLASAAPGLTSLSLNACQQAATDAALESVASGCPHLESVSLYWCTRVGDVAVSALATGCPRLTRLNLSGCKHVSDVGALSLVTLPLVALDVTRCVRVTDAGMAAVVAACPRLETLTMYACAGFSDTVYSRLGGLTDLQRLDLCGAQALTDAALAGLAACVRLRTLNLTWCTRVTDAGLVPALSALPSLEWLSVYGITAITDASLEALAAAAGGGVPPLRALDVSGCVGILRRAAGELRALFPRLTEFHLHS